MKILHINTFDTGGAATACGRIHLGLLEKGIDSKILLLRKTKNTNQTFQFKAPLIKVGFVKRVYKKIIKKVFKITDHKPIVDFKKIDKSVEYFSFPYSAFDITESELYKEADVIQINWASGFLNEETFFAKNTKPVVWRMPDLYACGSGYHYEKDFPFNSFKKELAENYKIREKSLAGKNIFFVAISNWQMQKANESALIGKFPKKVIHNGVNFNVFKPHDKNFARKVFNLPEDKIIILLGSESLVNKRKGFSLAIEAINKINNVDICLVTFGQTTNASLNNHIHVGEIKEELLLSILYSSADYFLMSSIEEAFGQVTIEAMACGLPVISFPNGGSLDIIKNGLNGILADDFTVDSLKIAIEKALVTKFSKSDILVSTHQNFNVIDKVDEYIELYKMLLNK